MKTTLLFLSVFFSLSLFGQSKKKQIEMLMVSKDSIQSLLDKEREAHTSSKTTLTNQIAELKNQIIDLKSNSETQNARIQNLESQLKKMETQLQVKEQENFTQKNTIDNLQSELNDKTDSVQLFELELQNVQQQMLIIESQLKNSRDSLELLQIEIVNLSMSYEIFQENSIGFKQVTIGSQTWMAENLNVSTFRNGDPIPEARTAEEWIKAGKNKWPAWCYYENDQKNGEKYGKLYNWYAVNDTRGLAPEGWHVPSEDEWSTLVNHLGEDAGKKMKSKSGWTDYGCKKCDGGSIEYGKICSACKGTRSNSSDPFSGNGSNSSGFNGLPGGIRFDDGTFNYFGSNGYWWSSTELTTNNAWARGLQHNLGYHLGRGFPNMQEGVSVRCLRD